MCNKRATVDPSAPPARIPTDKWGKVLAPAPFRMRFALCGRREGLGNSRAGDRAEPSAAERLDRLRRRRPDTGGGARADLPPPLRPALDVARDRALGAARAGGGRRRARRAGAAVRGSEAAPRAVRTPRRVPPPRPGDGGGGRPPGGTPGSLRGPRGAGPRGRRGGGGG